MSSYKIISGWPQAAWLASVARRAGARRGEALAVWLAVVDHAAAAAERGSISALAPEDLAALLEFDSALVEDILRALRGRQMLTTGGRITGWEKIQKKPSTARTRALRARRRAAEEDVASRARLLEKRDARRPAPEAGATP
jgi:hypothetical protein